MILFKVLPVWPPARWCQSEQLQFWVSPQLLAGDWLGQPGQAAPGWPVVPLEPVGPGLLRPLLQLPAVAVAVVVAAAASAPFACASLITPVCPKL